VHPCTNGRKRTVQNGGGLAGRLSEPCSDLLFLRVAVRERLREERGGQQNRSRELFWANRSSVTIAHHT